eukprot:363759-Chlamydomonas_euryale.AAC.29
MLWEICSVQHSQGTPPVSVNTTAVAIRVGPDSCNKRGDATGNQDTWQMSLRQRQSNGSGPTKGMPVSSAAKQRIPMSGLGAVTQGKPAGSAWS